MKDKLSQNPVHRYLVLLLLEDIITAYQKFKSFIPVMSIYAKEEAVNSPCSILRQLAATIGAKANPPQKLEMWRYEQVDYREAVYDTLRLFAMRHRLVPFTATKNDLDIVELKESWESERIGLLAELEAVTDEDILCAPGSRKLLTDITDTFFHMALKCLTVDDFYDSVVQDIARFLAGKTPISLENLVSSGSQSHPKLEEDMVQSLMKMLQELDNDTNECTSIVIHIEKPK
jgi:hypothetical protein